MPTSDGRRQRAVRRQRADPAFGHIRASSAAELPVRRQSGDGPETLTPNFVEDVVSEKATEKNIDDTAARPGSAFTEQRDPARTSLPVKDQRASQTRPLVRRKQATGDIVGTKRGTVHRVRTGCATQSVPRSILRSISKSDSESVSVVRRQTSSSRSAGVSPTVSSDRLSQDTSSSAVTVDYDEEAQHSTDLKVLERGSPDSRKPTFTDPAAHQPVDCSPDSSFCDSSPFDEVNSERLESENDEDRKKTTSGVQLDGVQSSAGSFLVKQTSADVVNDFTATQEDISHLDKIGQVAELEESRGVSGMSGTGQTGVLPGKHHDDTRLENDSDVATLDVTQRDSVRAVQRRRRASVVAARRRPTGKPSDVLRGRHADQVPNIPKNELDASVMVSPALQNGVEPTTDDEDRSLETKRFT